MPMTEGRADIFLTYCTNAAEARSGRTRPCKPYLCRRSLRAYQFAMFILSAQGQRGSGRIIQHRQSVICRNRGRTTDELQRLFLQRGKCAGFELIRLAEDLPRVIA
jgi:hypothetical protein